MPLPPLPVVGEDLNVWGTKLNTYLTALAAQAIQVVSPVASGDDGASLTAAAQAAVGSGASLPFLGGNGQTCGLLILSPNQVYNLQTPFVIPPGCEVWGSRGTILAASGNAFAGPAVQAQGNQLGTQVIQGVGTRILGCTIDGTGVNAVSMCGGLEIGGQYDIVLQDTTIQNFTSSGNDNGGTTYTGFFPLGAYGISVCNRQTLTEKIILRNVTINNCGTPNLTATAPSQAGGAAIQFVHPVGGAPSTSNMYSFMDVHLNQQMGQNGIVIARQAQPWYGTWRIKGNFFSQASGINGAACFVIGVGSNAQSNQGHFSLGYFDVNVECTNGAGGTTQPYTVWFGPNADNQWNNGLGTMRFSNFRSASNSPQFVVGGASPSMQFSGRIWGDSQLANVGAPVATPVFGTQYTNNGNDAMVSIAPGSGATNILYNGVAMGVTSGNFFLPAHATIQINGSGAAASWVWAPAVING